MSTPLAWACVAAFGSALTLKPSTMALDADASITSDSVTVPTELWMTLRLTSPASICLCKSSRVIRVALLPLSRSRSLRTVAICRAFRSSATTSIVSPACGTPERPRISTGSDGPALCTFLPRSLKRARTRPECEPTTTASPSLSVPDWIRAVATGPRPRSSRPSTITPRPARAGLARSSRISAWSAVISRSCGMPSPRLAEVWMKMVCPPQSSGTRPWLDSSRLTRSGSEPGLSILFTATRIGTLAALAWLIASTVWGITPSSAATTRTTMSVAWAPRARMAVNASWPGVSRKVTLPWLVSTWYAPMCWVMPPNSRSATLVVRIASSSEVLPWSTWPITVTTGGRGRICAGSDSSSSSTSPSIERTCTSKWNLSATSLAAVGSSTSLTVAITPRSTSALITSVVLWRIAAASSPTVTDSGSLISSRLISCGGSGGGGRGMPGPGAGLDTAGASGAIGGAASTGPAAGAATAAGRAGVAGRGGAGGAAGRGGEITVRGGFSGGGTGARRTGGAGLSSTGGAAAAGRTGGAEAGGPAGLGDAAGGSPTEAAAGATGGAGAISGGAAGGATEGAGLKMVAAGLAASSAGAGESSITSGVSSTDFAAVFFAPAFFFGAGADA